MASSEHYFYVLACADGSFYAGYTTDPLRREQEHNKGIGSKYTKARRPVQMIHKEVFGSRAEATKAEAAFKKLSRKQKEAFLMVRQLADRRCRQNEPKAEENEDATAKKL